MCVKKVNQGQGGPGGMENRLGPRRKVMGGIYQEGSNLSVKAEMDLGSIIFKFLTDHHHILWHYCWCIKWNKYFIFEVER